VVLPDTGDRLQLRKRSPFPPEAQKAQPRPYRAGGNNDYFDLPVHEVGNLICQAFNDLPVYPVPFVRKDLRPDLDRYSFPFSFRHLLSSCK